MEAPVTRRRGIPDGWWYLFLFVAWDRGRSGGASCLSLVLRIRFGYTELFLFHHGQDSGEPALRPSRSLASFADLLLYDACLSHNHTVQKFSARLLQHLTEDGGKRLLKACAERLIFKVVEFRATRMGRNGAIDVIFEALSTDVPSATWHCLMASIVNLSRSSRPCAVYSTEHC